MTDKEESRSLSRTEIAIAVVIFAATLFLLVALLPRLILLLGGIIIGASALPSELAMSYTISETASHGG